MRFVKQVTIHAPRAVVWDFLWDISKVAACIPGCQTAEMPTPSTRYKATVQEKVGPFRLNVPLDIDILERLSPERFVAQARGQDSMVRSHVKVHLTLALTEVDEHNTVLQAQVDVAVMEKLGTLGRSVIVRKGETIVEQFAAALQAVLQQESG